MHHGCIGEGRRHGARGGIEFYLFAAAHTYDLGQSQDQQQQRQHPRYRETGRVLRAGGDEDHGDDHSGTEKSCVEQCGVNAHAGQVGLG
jgi:hypothetical protein